MEIYLVRHTTPHIEKGICYGQSDIELTKDFPLESKEIIKKIPFSKNTVVYSSPLKRCTQLAALFSKNYKTNSSLLELNFGDWELKKWDTIPKKELTPWMENFVEVTVPNGESYIDLYTRVLSFYKKITKSKPDRIIFITHGGVIRSLLAHLTKTPLKDSFNIKVTYGQISKITISSEKTTVIPTL